MKISNAGNPGDLIPFGKYKGQPVDQLQNDPEYTNWLVNQPWFVERYANIHTLIVNNFAEPSDSPAHNAFQAKFLDEAYAVRAALVVQSIGRKLGQVSRMPLSDASTWSGYIDKEVEFDCTCSDVERSRKNSVDFEVYGWDVSIDLQLKITGIREQVAFKLHGATFDSEEAAKAFCVSRFLSPEVAESAEKVIQRGQPGLEKREIAFVELKPTMGDDFPSTLRQVKARWKSWFCGVIIEQFSATSVDFASVQKMFGMSRIVLLRESDILEADIPGELLSRFGI